MFKPNDPPARGKQLGRRLAAISALVVVGVTGLVLQSPLGATAVIDSGTGIAPRDPPPPAAPNQKPQAAYQLRCWQHGRLLFDEGPVTLGPEARQGARLVAIDRHGAPLVVTVAGETTCQARPFNAPASPALHY